MSLMATESSTISTTPHIIRKGYSCMHKNRCSQKGKEKISKRKRYVEALCL